MKKLQNKDLNSIIAIIAAAALMFSTFMWKLDPKDVIVYTLTMVVYIELSMLLLQFITRPDHKVSLRILIDSFIAFFLRELVIASSDHHLSFTERKDEVYLYLLIIVILTVSRILVSRELVLFKKGD